MGRCCATESGRSSAIRGKSIPLTIRDSSFPCRGSTSASHPRSARRCCIRRGASSRGKQFAAGHAECVFVAAPSKVLLKKTVADIRRRAAEAGRDPHSILIFNLQTVIVGDTDREAQAKWQEYKQYVSYEGALALLSGWTGIDFGQYQPDQVLKYLHTNAIQSAVEAFSTADPNRQWTVQAPADWAGIGGFGPLVVGSAQTVADELQSWVEETDVDGFNLAYAVTHETFRDVVELLVPELQKARRL